jgi:4-alpha-glucanotransferase
MKRESGILLSVTSLPSKYGIGCFDQAAYDFVDWLEKAGQHYWQILPLGATSHAGAFDSPYQAYSAFAGNPYFISLDALVEEGVLTQAECDSTDFGTNPQKVDYALLYENRLPLLRKAYQRSNISLNAAYQRFISENAWWLDDYALFMAVKAFFGGQSWTQWPQDIRMHYGYALDYYREKLYFDVEFQKYLQFKFYEQWSKLKKYANDKHIQIVGDIPIYVSPDGSDVWAKPEMFQLDENNVPTQIAGCPPDSFSADGQVWGNPLYRWDYHKATGFQWWVSRMWYSYKLYDVVRIDHFRGFDEYFSIPAKTGLAKDGHWEKGPGMELFNALTRHLGERGVIAEDLGHMTESVRKLVKDSGYPNMKVLQFAFDEGDTGGVNEYLPHNYHTNCWVYTGTHDNETLAGWFAGLSKAQRDQIKEYLMDTATPNKNFYKKLINLTLMCAARTCVIPVQDWLGLDNSSRMNVPGTVDINWSWRLLPGQLTDELCQEVCTLTKRFARANWPALNALEKANAPKEAEEKEPAEPKN